MDWKSGSAAIIIVVLRPHRGPETPWRSKRVARIYGSFHVIFLYGCERISLLFSQEADPGKIASIPASEACPNLNVSCVNAVTVGNRLFLLPWIFDAGEIRPALEHGCSNILPSQAKAAIVVGSVDCLCGSGYETLDG